MNFITKRIRQIFFMNKIYRRVVSAVLTVCMVAGFMQIPGFSLSAKAGSADLSTTVTKITLKGNELTDDTIVKNGDPIKISFNWALDNLDKTTDRFEVDLNALKKTNISISNSANKNTLLDVAFEPVGFYWVEDGRLIVEITSEEFRLRDNRHGAVSIEGVVQIDDTNLKDGDPVTIELGDKKYTPTFTTGIPTSEVTGQKAASGSLTKDANGNFVQKFTMEVKANAGDVSNISIADTPGEALGSIAEIQIESSTTDDITLQSFASLADLNSYLAGKTLPQDKKFVVSYTTTVDHSNTDWNKFKNTATVTYTDNKGATGTKNWEAWAYPTDPSVNKSGVLSADGSAVTWTVTVNLGDYEPEDVQSIKDIPGLGLVDTTAFDIPFPEGWTANGKIYTYTIADKAVTDEYKESVSSAEITNTAKLTMEDGSEYTTTGKVYTEPKPWVKKNAGTYNQSTKELTWDVVLDPIPVGVTDVVVSDVAGAVWVVNKGNISNTWKVEVDNQEVITAEKGKGAYFDEYLESYDEWNPAQQIKLKNSYVQEKASAGQPITVTFTTVINDESLAGKVYTNQANVTYKDPVLQETKTQSATAQYKNTSDLLTKTGEAIGGQDSIRYKVKIYLDGYEPINVNDTIAIQESFPDELKMSDTADKTATVEDPWGNVKAQTTPSYDEATKQFTIQLTPDMVNQIGSDNPYLVLTYTLDVKDRAKFAMDGGQDFVNTASAKYNDNNIGSDSAMVHLEPQDVVSKSGVYNIETAPYAEYTVLVNEDALDLVNGSDYISATDTMGSALSYDIASVKVQKYEAGNWTELVRPDGYKMTYDEASNSLVFNNLPDEAYLKITYRARVNLGEGEALNAENATNAFSLSGSSSDAVKAEKGFSVMAVKPDAWATSSIGKINLYKYWTSDGNMVALNGSKFRVDKVKYDAASNSMIPDPGKPGDVDYNNGNATLISEIEVESNGSVTIDGLSYSRIYALYETEAPTGYAKREEPYYFVLADSDAVLPPESSGIVVKPFTAGGQLLYENYKSDKGTLEVTKSLKGVDAADISAALAKLSFVVKDSSDNVVDGGSFNGSTMTLVDGVYKKVLHNLDEGAYTVTETVTSSEGYVYHSSTYKVTVGEDETVAETDYVNGSDKTVTVENEKVTTVAFENTYRKTAGIKVQKAVSGDADWDQIKSVLKFEVYKNGSPDELVATISGTDMTLSGDVYTKTVYGLDASATYYVKEVGAALSGYTKTTTYQIGTEEAADGETTADIILTDDVVEMVTFTNDYEVNKGTIKLTKVLTTESQKTWDEIKSGLEFVIKSGTTGTELHRVSGDDFVYNDVSGLYEYSVPMEFELGSYVVAEVINDLTGVIVTTSHKVDSGAEVSGKEAVVTISSEGQESVVAYSNDYKLKTATLVVRKTVTGEKTWDDIKNSISFKVTYPDNTTEKIIPGNEFTNSGDGVYVYKLEGLTQDGDYTVEEIFSSEIVDYTRATVVKVDNETQQAGDSVVVEEFSVPDGATVHFTNDYKRDTGKLRLEKTLSGVDAADVETAENAIRFEVKPAPDGSASKVYKLSEFKKASDGSYWLEIDDVLTGTYQVKEVVYDLNGYDTKSVTYTRTASTGAGDVVADGKDNGASLEVVKDKTTSLEVVDTYEKHVGSLVITKSVTGKNWDDVKEKLAFHVTNAANGYDETFDYRDFSGPDANGLYTCTIENLALGTYQVTEILQEIAGTVCKTTYKIGAGSAVNGKEAQLSLLSKGQEAHVAYVNAYDNLTGILLLKKSVKGDRAWEDVRDTLNFVVETEGYKETFTYTDFTGPDSDGNYTCTVENLVDGKTYTIREVVSGENMVSYTRTTTVKVDGGTAVSGLQNSIVFDADTGATATITNSYKRNTGKLILNKTLAGIESEDLAQAKNDIVFTVMPSPTGVGSSKTYKLSEFTEKANGLYSLEIPNALTGTYTVKETAYNVNNYDVLSVEYSMTVGAATVAVADGMHSGATAPVSKNGTTIVTVTDTYKKQTGNLKLTKVVAGGVSFDDVKEKISFRVTGPNGYDETFEGVEFTGNSKEITGLALGEYTITETVKDVVGYEYVSTVNSTGSGTTTAEVEVTGNTTKELSFTNTYSAVETGKILIQKTLKGDITEEEAKGALEFKVTNTDTDEEEIYTLKDFTKQADGTYTLELDANVGGYTIEETVYDVDGYVTDSVKYSVDGSPMTDGTKADITVVKDTTTEVVFEDAYTKDEGKLVITKTIKGDVTKEEAEGALQFKVTDTGTGKSETYTLKDFTYDAATGVYTLELDVPSGTYTVEETIYDVKGYITASIKRKVGTGEYASGTTADAKVEIGKRIRVDFEDTYEKNEGKLVLTKSVKGDLAWDDIKDDLSFVVKNVATGESKTYKASAFKDDDGDGVYMLVIEGLTRGEYTVTEKLDDEKGYLLETMYTVDGGSKNYGSKAKVTLGKEGVQVDFVNTYTSTKGKLVITKTLKGTIERKDAEAVLEFKVTNTKTNKSKTYTLDDFTYDKEAGKYTLELSLEPGTYKVTETVYDVDGYKLKSVTYQVGDGEREEGNSAKAKVETGETIKVAFVDKYYKTKTSDNSITQTPPTSTTTSTTTDRDTPKTGDESPLALWFMMLLFGACGIVGSIYGLRKNKK